jgi:triosephosphate isomerase
MFAAVGHGLSPILCVGESLDERHRHQHHSVVSRQVHQALRNLPPPRHGQEVVVAYEPIWAIGSGEPAEPDEARIMSRVIHQALVDTFGERLTNTATRRLYGGSVTPANVRAFVDGDDIQGVLLGNASQQAGSFLAIVNALT